MIKALPQHGMTWPAGVLDRLGKVPDSEIAVMLGIRTVSVLEKRKQLGIPSWKSKQRNRVAVACRNVKGNKTLPPWQVVIHIRTTKVIYCGRDAAVARAAYEADENTVWTTDASLGDAQTRAVLCAGQLREADRKKQDL